jgi:hypothetical protein
MMQQDRAPIGRWIVHTAYESPYPDHIRFAEGERVRVGEVSDHDADWPDWIRCYGEAGQEAWAPAEFLEVSGDAAVFLRDYDARELTVTPGEVFEAFETVNGFAWGRTDRSGSGWVPLKCLSPVPPGLR